MSIMKTKFEKMRLNRERAEAAAAKLAGLERLRRMRSDQCESLVRQFDGTFLQAYQTNRVAQGNQPFGYFGDAGAPWA